MLLSMMANSGVIKCYGVDTDFKPGALAAEAPNYRGRVYIAAGAGTAEISDWSPNHADVRVAGAGPGALLVYNMNYDASWRANGEPALDYNGLVATRLTRFETPDSLRDTRRGEGVKGDVAQVTFRYFPRTLRYSWLLSVLTLGLVARALRRPAPNSATPQPDAEG